MEQVKRQVAHALGVLGGAVLGRRATRVARTLVVAGLLVGVLPVALGPLSTMGFTCEPVAGRTDPTLDRRDVVDREKERFGGIKIVCAFFGWITATGMTVLLTALAVLWTFTGLSSALASKLFRVRYVGR